MMWIKQIIKCYEDDVESDVIVTDGRFELMCYALYCENNVGDVDFTLSPFDCRLLQQKLTNECEVNFYCSDVMTSEVNEYRIQKLESGYYDYKLQGKLIAVEKDIGTVQIGGIIISGVRYIPKDIRVGEYVEFAVIRLEL